MGGSVPKPLLEWGSHTVIEQVVAILQGTDLDGIAVVTGHRREEIEAILAGLPVRCVYNPDYRTGDMLSSIQAGLRSLPEECAGALVALADQPQIETCVVRQVVEAFRRSGNQSLVVPSYRMRRGHPILLPRRVWPTVLALGRNQSLRTIMRAHTDEIAYALVDTPSIFTDLDTPEQYRQAVPKSTAPQALPTGRTPANRNL